MVLGGRQQERSWTALLLLVLPALPSLCASWESELLGTPLCWGSNTHGQSEVQSTESRYIACGMHSTCGIDGDGDVWCNGGETEPLVVPSNLTATAPALEVVVGKDFACVRLANGSVICFGPGDSRGFGETQVPEDLGVVRQLAAGESHVCALLASGAVSCWGRNTYFQADVPNNLTASQIAAGSYYTCALVGSGTAQCWGYDEQGQATVPVELDGRVKQLSLGESHTCALLEDDSVKCWGTTHHGERDVPPGLAPVAHIELGPWHSCVVHLTRDMTCWGWSTSSQTSVPEEVRDGTKVALQLSAGGYHTCALLTDPTTNSSTMSTSSSSDSGF